MASAKRTKRGYSGSVTVPSSERKWDMYESNGRWLVSRSGGFGKVYSFKSKAEAEAKKKAMANKMIN